MDENVWIGDKGQLQAEVVHVRLAGVYHGRHKAVRVENWFVPSKRVIGTDLVTVNPTLRALHQARVVIPLGYGHEQRHHHVVDDARFHQRVAPGAMHFRMRFAAGGLRG